MGEIIELKASDGHALQAYRAGPRDASRTLVVVQEIFGVNAHMRAVCEEFAEAGYGVVARALFDRVERGIELGYGPDGVARGRALRGQIADVDVMLDIEAAATSLEGVRGIVGYCWGGTVAWWGATRSSSFRAAVGWYGGGIAATREEMPHCPVQLHFGAEDQGIPMTDVELVRVAQPEVEVFVYPGAGHGFGCDERDSFNAEATRLARERTLEFLDATL